MNLPFLRPKRPRLVECVRKLTPEQAARLALGEVWMSMEAARRAIAERRKERSR